MPSIYLKGLPFVGTTIFLFYIDYCRIFSTYLQMFDQNVQISYQLGIEKLKGFLFTLFIFALSFTISLKNNISLLLNQYDFKNTQATFDYIKD